MFLLSALCLFFAGSVGDEHEQTDQPRHQLFVSRSQISAPKSLPVVAQMSMHKTVIPFLVSRSILKDKYIME